MRQGTRLSSLLRFSGTAFRLCSMLALAAMPACQSQPRPAEPAVRSELTVIVESYNTRVRDLARLRAPVTMIINSPKEGGGRSKDQVEGNLQVMLPSSVALRIDKVGQALAYLGSNQQQYWWFDLGEEKRAYVGAHALASMDKARRFGLPVHPLDLVELAGVTPLPNASLLTFSRGPSGEDIVTVPGRWTTRRLHLDAATHEPVRIEVVARDGRVVIESALSRYQPVEVDGNVFTKARIASTVEISILDADVQASIAIVEPRNPGDKLRLKAFDLDAMLASYNIKNVIDMDAPPVQSMQEGR